MIEGVGLRDVLLMTVVIVCALIAVRQPVFGILVFVGFAFLNPQSMAWAVAHPVQPIAIGTLIGYLFWSEPKRLPLQRETVVLLALWVAFGVSTIAAMYPGLAFDQFSHVSKILITVMLCLSLITTRERLQWLVRVVALSLGLYALRAGVFVFATRGQFLVFGPENSFLEANNSIGLALAMNVPLLWCLLKTEQRRWVRRLVKAMLIFSYPAIVCTFSRGAWLGLAAATALMVLKTRRRLVTVTVLGVLLIALSSTLPRLLPERVRGRYGDLVRYEQEASAQSRFWTWEFCRRVGFARPFTGAGFVFASRETYAMYYPEFLQAWNDGVKTCHSTWFTVLGEHGVLALGLWVSLLGSCLLSLRRLRRYGRSRASASWIAPYADALPVSIIVYMIVGSFVDAAYFDMFYYLVAIVILLKALADRPQAGADESTAAPPVRTNLRPIMLYAGPRVH